MDEYPIQGRGGQGQRGRGGQAMAENKLPVSPNAGQTVGLYLDTPRAYNGYTLMAPMHYTKTYLINNAGEVVHRWSSTYEPGRSAFLLENGRMRIRDDSPFGCIACGHCMMVCPEGSITVTGRGTR